MDIPENLVVWGDKGCIRRAVSNALRNAVTYAGSKGPIRVRTGFRPVDNAVLLRWSTRATACPKPSSLR